MNSNERDSILMDRNNLYDKLSRVLTDYEEDNCDAEDLYDMLAEIQNAWEGTITCQIDTSDEQKQSFKLFNKYPALKKFAERMSEITEDILSKAVEQSSEKNSIYIAELDEYNKPGEPIISPALLDAMLTDSEMVEDTILHDDSIELCLTELTASNQYRVRYDANWTTELEIICAKHALWIYGESGGERADFSNCLLENVNLSNCNLCGADFSGATFINCNLDDASMCDADFESAKFKRCSLRHFTAEEGEYLPMDDNMPLDVYGAVELLLKSSDQGNEYASYTLGKIFIEGELLLQDISAGFELLLKATEKNCIPAWYFLGKMFYNGLGVEKDIDAAIYYFEKAVKGKNLFAAYQLGKIYSSEEGYIDMSKAIDYFMIAVQDQNSFAEYQLGKIYLYGNGVKKDYDIAMRYLHLSADHGNQYAEQLLYSIQKQKSIMAAMSSLRLLQHISNLIRRKNQEQNRRKIGQTDRKMQQKINEKKQAHGLKPSM